MSSYTYTELQSALGIINVIAVVKFFRAPVKSTGSGYSLFVSITDPSLSGGKLQCNFFHDCKDSLPQIQAPGDVVILHRLRVREFRGQNQGYGSPAVGFAAAVFPGALTDPLEPRPSAGACSFGEDELRRVQELREWYHSPNCPVERELPSSAAPISRDTVVADSGSTNTSGGASVLRPWNMHLHQYCSTEGQIIGVYPCAPEARCLVVYLWDGAPASVSTRPRFFGPSNRDMPGLLRRGSLEPRIAITAGHRSRVVEDWSVPVFLYDEHATVDLHPGDLVRINNLHVLPCHEGDCDIPGCFRLIVHGGGHKLGRGVVVLGPCSSLLTSAARDTDSHVTTETPSSADDLRQKANQYGLLTRLEQGLACRPCYLRMNCDEPQTLLTITQICSVPSANNQMETEMLFCSDIPLPMEPGFCLPVPRSSWVHLDEPPHSNRSSVAVRLQARVLEVYPNSVDDLQNCTVLACQRCRTATRLSSILDGNEDPCECNTSPLHANGTEHPSKRVLCPFVLLKLEDPTGQLVVCAPATSGVALLTRSTDQATQNAQWDQVANELFGSHATDERAVAKNLLRQLSNLLTRSVELVLRVSWLSSWELGEPILIGQLDLKFELLNEQPLTWSTCND